MTEDRKTDSGSGDRGGQLVLVDAGNTNTVFGVWHDGGLLDSFRIATERERTADEIAALLWPLFSHLGVDPKASQAMVISSVVPPLGPSLDLLAHKYFGLEPYVIDPQHQKVMKIRYEHPAEVGADRIVNAVAAREIYGAPVVVVDFGTATTFDVVNREGEYAGGIISPGIGISAEALFAQASRLYRVDIRRPERLVGQHTAEAMQSGIYYGYIGLVDGILRRLYDEIPDLRTVVATGGQAEMIAAGSELIREVAPQLTLIGMTLMYERRDVRAP